MESILKALDMQSIYDKKGSYNYRKGDEISKQSPNLIHRCEILKKLSISFNHKITALDLGCGTGRYFYCLQNTKNLTAVDISQYMLECARNPINREKISIDHINLICGDILNLELPPEYILYNI